MQAKTYTFPQKKTRRVRDTTGRYCRFQDNFSITTLTLAPLNSPWYGSLHSCLRPSMIFWPPESGGQDGNQNTIRGQQRCRFREMRLGATVSEGRIHHDALPAFAGHPVEKVLAHRLETLGLKHFGMQLRRWFPLAACRT